MAVNERELEKRRAERLLQEEEELRESTKELLRNPHFRRFLWWELSLCGIYSMNISANSTMYIAEGQRAIGLRILDHINSVDPRLYPEMLLEKADAEIAARAIEGDEAKHVSDTERQDV